MGRRTAETIESRELLARLCSHEDILSDRLPGLFFETVNAQYLGGVTFVDGHMHGVTRSVIATRRSSTGDGTKKATTYEVAQPVD